MNSTCRVAAVLFPMFFGVLACCGQTTATLACVSRLELPYYDALARDAQIQGSAKATFRVAPDGSPADLLVEASHELLRRRVEGRVAKSKFKEDCAGARLTLRVRFVLSRPRTRFGPTEITLVAPDMVEVTTTLPELREPQPASKNP